jgi:hypothetical protein
MSATRVPFDPEAPQVVASETLVAGSRRFRRGEPFPWGDLGLTLTDAAELWVAGQIDTVSDTPQLAAAAQPTHGEDHARISPEQRAEREVSISPPPPHVVTPDPPRAPAPSSKRHHRR